MWRRGLRLSSDLRLSSNLRLILGRSSGRGPSALSNQRTIALTALYCLYPRCCPRLCRRMHHVRLCGAIRATGLDSCTCLA